MTPDSDNFWTCIILYVLVQNDIVQSHDVLVGRIRLNHMRRANDVGAVSGDGFKLRPELRRPHRTLHTPKSFEYRLLSFVRQFPDDRLSGFPFDDGHQNRFGSVLAAHDQIDFPVTEFLALFNFFGPLLNAGPTLMALL